ncbi:thioredoxin fold domain-containing protein [Rubrivirga sp. S365]|uniref:thioredoxin family protein n=1 Tax=Rubrivirga sp. S365 TaxID=3076080 RepID=UPI0028CA8E25|nr:thioredoxin fold domain-containing protein [Rubrivirga sp. S365]MDT7856221.1 thioredoxin fold domain-containing protein [Rubrivirga sp. S365]
MTRRLALLLLLAAPLAAGAQDASVVPDDAPDWLSMGDAIAAAQAEGKLLLVYGYAPWCGYCVRFDREVFTDDAVQAYLAEHFAPVRLNLDSEAVVPFFDVSVSEAELGQAMRIAGTPTSVFVAADGEMITKFPGYSDPETFGLVLRYVREEAYETATFEDFLEARRSVSQ